MKFYGRLFSLFGLMLFGLMLSMVFVFAQDTPPPPADAPALPPLGWPELMITTATPILIAAVKELVPKIPKVLIPIAAPFVGMLLQVCMNYLGLTDGGTIQGLLLGAAGVALREAVDQLSKIGGPTRGEMSYAFGLLCVLGLAGCMMPNFNRVIPENKDANVYILSPMYGQVIVQTRVNPGGSNTLPALSTDVPVLTLK